MDNAQEAGPEVDGLGNGIAEKYGGTVTPVNYKSSDSIKRKVNDELGGDISQLKDSVRNTVIIDHDKLDSVASDLANDPQFIRVKVQSGPEYYGYKGVITNVKLSNGTIGEMQVNSPGMIFAKEEKSIAIKAMGEVKYNEIAKSTGMEGGGGHKYYEELRKINLNTASGQDKKRYVDLVNKSKEYYSKFYNH